MKKDKSLNKLIKIWSPYIDWNQINVAHFMNTSKQKIRFKPTSKISEKEFFLRRKLIHSEMLELFASMDNNNIEEIADALADLLYVVYGTANTYGINIFSIFEAVCQANMLKFKGGIKLDKNGKVIKPKKWKHPDIKKLLIEQGAKL